MKLTRILGCASFAPLALAMTMADGAQAADKYVVGVSNTLTGNGWREEMICSIKAEAFITVLSRSCKAPFRRPSSPLSPL